MPVYICVGVGGKRQSLQLSVNGTRTNEAAKQLNTLLDTLKTKVYEAQRKLVDEGEAVTTNTIREIITWRNRNPKY